MTYIDLKTLPEDHPLRNTLLDKIGAEFKHCRSAEFTLVVPGRPLANDTYNELEGVYASNLYQWRVRSSTTGETNGT